MKRKLLEALVYAPDVLVFIHLEPCKLHQGHRGNTKGVNGKEYIGYGNKWFCTVIPPHVSCFCSFVKEEKAIEH